MPKADTARGIGQCRTPKREARPRGVTRSFSLVAGAGVSGIFRASDQYDAKFAPIFSLVWRVRPIVASGNVPEC